VRKNITQPEERAFALSVLDSLDERLRSSVCPDSCEGDVAPSAGEDATSTVHRHQAHTTPLALGSAVEAAVLAATGFSSEEPSAVEIAKQVQQAENAAIDEVERERLRGMLERGELSESELAAMAWGTPNGSTSVVESSPHLVGMHATIVGLSSDSALNYAEGTVVGRCQDTRLCVQLDRPLEGYSHRVNVRPSNLVLKCSEGHVATFPVRGAEEEVAALAAATAQESTVREAVAAEPKHSAVTPSL